MRRLATTLTLAAVTGLIVLSLLGGAASGDSGAADGAPKALTHHFPLGTQTLSHSKTAPSHGSTTGTRRVTPTTPGATAHRSRASQPARRHGGHGFSPVLFLLAIPVLIGAALLGRVAIRDSRRGSRRRAHARPTPARSTRLTAHSRWAYEDADERERTAPPLPVRPRGK